MDTNQTFCPLNATTGYSDLSPITLNGDVYDMIFYGYDCSKSSSVQQLFYPKRKLIGCYCTRIKHDDFDSFVCNAKDYKSLISFELSVAIIGAILNAMVLEVYSQLKPNMRHKVSNILLASQALIDILMLIQPVPSISFHFIAVCFSLL